MRLLLAIVFFATSAISFAQNTLVRSFNSSTSGPLGDLASVANSGGMTTIYKGRSASGVDSVSVVRYSGNGGLVGIESTTELVPGESLTGLAGFVDTLGKYHYVFSYQDSAQTTQLGLRGSSEAVGGVAGGWMISLGAQIRGVPSICNGYDPSLVEILVPTATGYRLIFVKKSSGAVAMDKSFVEPNFGGTALLRSSSDGRTCVLYLAQNNDTTLICYNKSGSEIWRKSVPLLVTLPSGAQEVKTMIDVAMGNGKTVLFTRVVTALDTFEHDLKVERLNSLSGAVEATTLLQDVEATANPLVESKFLKNGDLSFVCLLDNFSDGFTVARLNSQAGLIWETDVQVNGPIGLNNQIDFCDAAIDESGNVSIINEGSSGGQTYGTSVKYVDNNGAVRWEQIVAPTSSSFSQDAINVDVDPAGKIYLGFQNVPIVNQQSNYAGSQLRFRQYQPATFMPVASDARGVMTSHLYWSANESSIRVVRSGTPNASANYTPGDAFRPLSIFTATSGNALVLFSGIASGSGRVATFSPSSAIASSVTDFTLPVGSGLMRDVASDSAGRTWIMSTVNLGNSYYVKYHRLNIAGTAVDISRTVLISNIPSGVFGFEPFGSVFRFGCTMEGANLSANILTGGSDGSFVSELILPLSGMGVQDLRNTTAGKSFVLLSDKVGLIPGRYWRTNTTATALDQDFELPWSPGLIPVGIGAVDINNARVIWHELGGKIQFRTMFNGGAGVATTLQAVMN